MVTFTEEIFNGKLHFFAVNCLQTYIKVRVERLLISPCITILSISFFFDCGDWESSYLDQIHSMKCDRIRSYFWFVFSCIQFEYRKIRTRNNSVFGHFLRSDYAVTFWLLLVPIDGDPDEKTVPSL